MQILNSIWNGYDPYIPLEVIFTDFENNPASDTARAGKLRLIVVLLFVLIFCGGNGAGILIGFFLWKVTGNKLTAVLVMLAITVFAFAMAMVLVSVILKSVAEEAITAVPEQEILNESTETACGSGTVAKGPGTYGADERK